MSVHQCPKCELKFAYKTEVDDHCWHDHPEFRHEYPAVAVKAAEADPHEHPAARVVQRRARIAAAAFGSWLQPTRPKRRRIAGEEPPT